jgi:hypothetical protein
LTAIIELIGFDLMISLTERPKFSEYLAEQELVVPETESGLISWLNGMQNYQKQGLALIFC